MPPPPALEAWLAARRPLPARAAYLDARYTDEPYRLVLALLAADLEAAARDDMTARLLEATPHAARVSLADLARPLDLVASALPPALAHDRLWTVRRQIEVFGLHAARLDVREESSRLAAALGELLSALGLGAGFAEHDDRARTETLRRLLAKPVPDDFREPGALARRRRRPGRCSGSSPARAPSTGPSSWAPSSSR